jgi:formate dehydrogenase subunit gamma
VPPTEADLIRRFGPTERALHWVHAAGFLAMLATGLVLYLPVLSELVARRNLVKNLHLLAAVAWVLALALVFVVGDRARLRADWREIESIDADDRRWLRGRRAPQGRFNAGQKINTILTVSFALLFVVSGSMLWLGERDHRFILDGSGTVHELLTLGSVGLLVGHLLPRRDPPDDSARAPGDDSRRRARGLGARASPEVGRAGAERPRGAITAKATVSRSA